MIHISHEVFIPEEDIRPDDRQRIMAALTYPNPEWYRLSKMERISEWRLRQVPKKLWDYRIEKGDLVLPRGAWLRCFGGVTTDLPSEDHRVACALPMPVSLAAHLRDYQKEAVAAIREKCEGLVVADCGAGKSVIGVAAIAALQQPTFIMVHEVKLVKQWEAELRDKLSGEFTIGVFGNGKKKLGDITIGLIQTLRRLSRSEMEVLASQFGMVIVDECHHIPAESFYHAINCFPAKYRIGLSATPKRKDRLEFRLFDALGPILYQIDSKQLEKEGRITSATVRIVNTHYISSHHKEDWSNAITALTKADWRNGIIVRRVVANVKEGRHVLVLSDRVEHCKMLVEVLKAGGLNSRLLLGETPADEREATRLDKKVQVIVGTTVADEGLDCPWLDTVHLTCPSNNKARVKQRIGRIRRICEGKNHPVVYDYQDQGCIFPVLSRNRERWYEEMGFGIEEREDVR